MTEPSFQRARSEIESGVELPDFDLVVERGLRIRRRRRSAATAGAVAAVAMTVLVVAVGVDPVNGHRGDGPVVQPTQAVESAAALVLADPDATVNVDNYAVSETGAVLTVVSAPGREWRQGCPQRDRAVFVWSDARGNRRAWSDYSTARAVDAVEGGFVVGAVDRACRAGDSSAEATPYLVDAAGRQQTVEWIATTPSQDAVVESCSVAVDDPRCRFSAATGTGRVLGVDPVSYPRSAIPLPTSEPGDRLWARSVDSRRLHWSEDGGRTWAQKDTRLPRDVNVSISVAGRRVAFLANTSVEHSSDGGSTWHVKELSKALADIRVADVRWEITESGHLLGVTALVGEGEQLFVSTDTDWSDFELTELKTEVGHIWPMVAGGYVYVLDADQWWWSADAGAHWETFEPLARTD